VESKRIADLVRGGILLAIAVSMAVLLHKFYQIVPRMGISIKQVFYFPIAVVAAICWLTYRGIRTIVATLRNAS
jgi:hypothetical protein